MSIYQDIARKLITLEHYYGQDSQRSPEHNWKVMLGDDIHLGDLHDCNGIGGQIGEFTETDLFDIVCDMAKFELEKLEYKPPHEALTGKPDFTYRDHEGQLQSEYWFGQKLMYCHYSGKVIPLSYDEEGRVLDHFDADQGFWIDLGEEITREYERWMSNKIDEQLLLSDEDKFNTLLEEAASALDMAQNLLGEDDKLSLIRNGLQSLIEDKIYKFKEE